MTDGVTAEQIGTNAPVGSSPVPVAVEPRDDIRADVLAAFDKLTNSDPAEKPVAAAAEDESSPDRPRNERGQFVKADDAPQQEAAPAEPVPDADEPQEQPQEPSPAAEAPKGWSADAKAKWSSLDPSIQAEVLKREQDMDNGGRQWSEEKRAYEQALAPLGGFAQRYGLDNQAALTRLLDWQVALERDPRGAILQLAQLSGVDLANPQQQSQPQPYDPRLDSVLSTVSELQQTHVAAQIDAFRTAPGHEHFDAVRADMGRMMESDPNLTMDAAYERAVWLNPGVRAKLIAAQVQPAQQKAKDQQQVQKAKAAAASPRGSGPSGNAPVPKPEYNTVREAVVAAARERGWNV